MASELDLEPIKKSFESISPRPWTVGERRDLDEVDLYEVPILVRLTDEEGGEVVDDIAVVRYRTGGFQYPHHDAQADAEFIAAARTDVPALVAEVRRLRLEVANRTAATGWSWWVSDEPDLNPTRWYWGCERCPDDGPAAVGGAEPTQARAFDAALAHERAVHKGVISRG